MADSLAGLNYSAFAPPRDPQPTALDYFQSGQQLAQGIIDQKHQADVRAANLRQMEERERLAALLGPIRIQEAQTSANLRELQARRATPPVFDSGSNPSGDDMPADASDPTVGQLMPGGTSNYGPGSGVGIVSQNRIITAPIGASANTVSNISAPDADGYSLTLGTTFATPRDIANFGKTGSLATGDNGLGAWGDRTTGSTPYVALPPSFLRSQGIDPNRAHNLPVTVELNGKTTQALVGDKMPDGSKNGAGLDLNPATANALGISDPDNFKGQVRFKLGSIGAPLSGLPRIPSTPIVTPGGQADLPTDSSAAVQSILTSPLASIGGSIMGTSRIGSGSIRAPAPGAPPGNTTDAPLPNDGLASSLGGIGSGLGASRIDSRPILARPSIGAARPTVPVKLETGFYWPPTSRDPKDWTPTDDALLVPNGGTFMSRRVPAVTRIPVNDEDGTPLGHLINGRLVRPPARGNAGALDQRSDLQVQRDLVGVGGDPRQFMGADGRTFDRLGAMSETARRNAEAPDTGSTGSKPMTEYQRKKEERLSAPKVVHDTYPHLSEDLKAQTGHTLADLLNTPPDNIHKEPGGLAYYLNDSSGMPSKRVFLSDEQHQQFVDRYNAIKGGSPSQINASPPGATPAAAASNAAPHVDSMSVGAIISQSGKRYQKQADGSWNEL